jgi:hypothetical protein
VYSQKGVIASAIVQERDLIKFDERDGRERAVEMERMGIGWKDALKEINLNLKRDLMEGDSEENSGRGRGNDVLSATEGMGEIRVWGEKCDWMGGDVDLGS